MPPKSKCLEEFVKIPLPDLYLVATFLSCAAPGDLLGGDVARRAEHRHEVRELLAVVLLGALAEPGWAPSLLTTEVRSVKNQATK